jgi:hypothetical protein
MRIVIEWERENIYFCGLHGMNIRLQQVRWIVDFILHFVTYIHSTPEKLRIGFRVDS